MIIIHSTTSKGWAENSGDTNLTVNQKTFNQNLILFNYEYTKGDETGFELVSAFKYNSIEDKSFFLTQESNGDVTKRTFTVQESGNGIIPISCPLSADEVEITVALINPGESPGSLEVWLIPDSYLF